MATLRDFSIDLTSLKEMLIIVFTGAIVSDQHPSFAPVFLGDLPQKIAFQSSLEVPARDHR
jgi:hypothetical protein